MSWIKLETHTFDKVEVYAIAQELGIDSDAVIGKCCRVWAWFDANTVDGVTLSVTSALLDRYCGVTGFTKAMINAGWMRDDGQLLMLPNYDRHNSKTAKSRALGAIRQSKFKSNAIGNAEGNASADGQALPKSSHREEKRREEEIREDNKEHKARAPKYDFVKSLIELGADEKSIRDWLEVRKKKRAANTESSIDHLVRESAKANISIADAVLICATRNWQNLTAEWLQPNTQKQSRPEKFNPTAYVNRNRNVLKEIE